MPVAQPLVVEPVTAARQLGAVFATPEPDWNFDPSRLATSLARHG